MAELNAIRESLERNSCELSGFEGLPDGVSAVREEDVGFALLMYQFVDRIRVLIDEEERMNQNSD